MSIAIDTLAIPTRDRRAAQAVVSTFAEVARERGRELRIVICDARDLPGKRAFVDALVQRGCDRDVVEFALLDPLAIGHTPGANRNFAQLVTLGRRVATFDDDLGPRTFRTQTSSVPRIAIDRDPSEFWFLGTPEEADALALPDADPIAALQHGLDLQVPQGWPSIAAAWMGVAGDPGTPSGLFWLVQGGASRERLGLDDEAYRAARSSGRTMRSVTAPTICSGHGWTPAAVAFDHRALLPPFLPVLRGQGLVWGATIHAGAAWALARVPGALEHRLAQPHAVDPRRSRAATLGMAVGHVVQAALTEDRLSGTPDPRTALGALGRRLADLVATRDRFAQWLEHAMKMRARGLAEMLTASLARHDRRPAAWAADVDRTLAELARVGQEPELVPYDLAPRPIELARDLLFDILGRFARLLQHWPEIVEAARRSEGPGLPDDRRHR